MSFDPDRIRNVIMDIEHSGADLSHRELRIISQIEELLNAGRIVPRWQLTRLSSILRRVNRR